MTYAVKEIFYTIQGEGLQAGRPAVFLRFSGCNLWNGREGDRGKGSGSCSLWCDTDFFGIDGPGGGRFDCCDSLVEAVASKWPPDSHGERFVVCTGGEPLLQLDADLVEALRSRGFMVAVETNGTKMGPAVDWLCVSPKGGTDLVLREGDELKLVFPQERLDPTQFENLAFRYLLLQPKDGPERERNTRAALEYCLTHPRWRLSLQTHKILGIP
jgi:7-carboxy-7-deazaguanine synthase